MMALQNPWPSEDSFLESGIVHALYLDLNEDQHGRAKPYRIYTGVITKDYARIFQPPQAFRGRRRRQPRTPAELGKRDARVSLNELYQNPIFFIEFTYDYSIRCWFHD